MKRVYLGDRASARRQATKAYRAANPERSRQQWREYKERKLLAANGGRVKPEVCDVCDRGGKICFDHSHATGGFRGWLCNHCNLALGHVSDDPRLLRKLADYLEGGRQ